MGIIKKKRCDAANEGHKFKISFPNGYQCIFFINIPRFSGLLLGSAVLIEMCVDNAAVLK